MEQSARLRTIYTQLCFCYVANHDYRQEQIVEKLRKGLRVLTEAVPWLAGQVAEQSGSFRVVPFRDSPILVVKDFTSDISVPTMQDFRDARFPFSMLDEELVCPRHTLSDGPGEDESQPYPVLVLQMSFLRGGVVLSISACHSTMDIVGQVQIITMLSRACRNEHFTKEETASCNTVREGLIDMILADVGVAAKSFQSPGPSISSTENGRSSDTSSRTKKLEWAYFAFSASRLRLLKQSVTSTLPGSTLFVSTDDCICALLWQSLARARLERVGPTAPLNFVRQVDVRKHLGIPNTYPGGMVTSVTDSLSLAKLSAYSPGVIASRLRDSLNPQALVSSVHALALKARDPSREQASSDSGKKKDRESTITMSSWTKADCADVDFDLGLGPPAAVRRPRFTPIEGVVYLLPKGKDDEILAGLCLREDDMEGLRTDEEFCKWVEYIG